MVPPPPPYVPVVLEGDSIVPQPQDGISMFQYGNPALTVNQFSSKTNKNPGYTYAKYIYTAEGYAPVQPVSTRSGVTIWQYKSHFNSDSP